MQKNYKKNYAYLFFSFFLNMTISIKIVNIDHCIRSPGALDRAYSPFCDKDLSKVPVIRIFGSTNSGQKACLYIHQVRHFSTTFSHSLQGISLFFCTLQHTREPYDQRHSKGHFSIRH